MVKRPQETDRTGDVIENQQALFVVQGRVVVRQPAIASIGASIGETSGSIPYLCPFTIFSEPIGAAGFTSFLCYNFHMKQKPLIETNPYLRDPAKFRKALTASVASSTAIETGAPVTSIARMLEDSAKTEPLKTTRGSGR